jgi:hypothetical protein
MTTMRNVSIFVLGLMVSAAVEASGQPPVEADRGGDVEVVIGFFECALFVGPGMSGAFLSFAGTSGVMTANLGTGGAEIDNPTENCEPLRAKLIAKAQSLGCTTGQLRGGTNPFDSSLTFKFVCAGRRDDLVRTIAEMSKKILTETP